MIALRIAVAVKIPVLLTKNAVVAAAVATIAVIIAVSSSQIGGNIPGISIVKRD